MLRNRIIYVMLLISSSLLVYYLPSLITSIFFHCVIYLMILSFIHLVIMYMHIKVTQNLNPKFVEHSGISDYTCIIYNESFLPSSIIKVNFLLNLNLYKDQLEPRIFTLFANKSIQFNYKLSCKYRGVYSVGIDTIELMDILNIFKLKISNVEPRKNITVLPKITFLPKYYLMHKTESDINSSEFVLTANADSMVDVKEYQQGDALKNIHWKLSARYDELLVRINESSMQNSLLLFLDLSKGKHALDRNLMIEDKLMEAFASIVKSMLYKNYSIELNYYEYDDVSVVYSDKNCFYEFLHHIAKLLFRHSKSIDSLINTYICGKKYTANLNGKDVFIFTCHPDSLEDNPEIRRLLNYRCTVHIISCTLDERKEGSYISNNGIQYYHLTPYSSIQDLFIRSKM